MAVCALVYCHTRPVRGEEAPHWQYEHVFVPVTQERFGDREVKWDTVDPLDATWNKATFKVDGFADKFLNEHSAEYDIVFLPDCGGTWWSAQKSSASEFAGVVRRVMRVLKPGGFLYGGKWVNLTREQIEEQLHRVQFKYIPHLKIDYFIMRKPALPHGAWNPMAPGAFDLAQLRTAAALLPRSNASRMYALLTAAAASEGGNIDGLDVLRRLYLAAMRVRVGGESVWRILRVGYFLNHPRRLLDPADYRDSSAPHMDPLPSEKDLCDTVAAQRRLACPWNTRGSSCFTDTPLVIMFVATDAYDAAVSAQPLPERYRVTPEERDLTEAPVDMVDWCSIGDGDPLALSAKVHGFVRKIAHRLRQPAGSGDEGRLKVGRLVSQLRDAVGPCFKKFVMDVAEGQEDMGMMYEMFLAVNGWTSWFVAPVVTLDVITRVGGTPLPDPIYKDYKVDAGTTGLRVKLKLPYDRPASRSETLQDLVDAATVQPWTEVEKVLAGEKELFDTIVKQGPEFAHTVAETRRTEGKMQIEITTRPFLAAEPPSGVLVFDATALSTKWGTASVDTSVELHRDRIVRVTVGAPHAPHALRVVEYRVFAAAIRDSIGASSGHYWCYFWRGDVMFGYNDIPPEGEDDILWRVTPLLQDRALATVADAGLFFFARKVIPEEDPSPPVPPGTPLSGLVLGITDEEDWDHVWSKVGDRSDVIDDLVEVLPRPGSWITVDGMDLMRNDLASVFPTQFMTSQILDWYGQRAAGNDAYFVPTHDMTQIYALTPGSALAFETVKLALKELGTVFVPVTNFRGKRRNPKPGDHWSLLVLDKDNLPKHYDSKDQNHLIAQGIIVSLETSGILPQETGMEIIETCIRQPESTSPTDPAAAACGSIVLGYIEAWRTGSMGNVLETDRKWRIAIMDDILDKSRRAQVHVRAVDVDDTRRKVAALQRLLTRMKHAAERYYEG